MKQGWEIKKLGEVCEVIGGSTPKTSDDTFWDGDYYWISPAELDGSKYVYSTTRTITDAGVRSAHLQILPIGTVLLSSRAPIGKVAITKVPMYCNQGFKNLVCGKDLINEYVYWFLKHNTDYLNSLGTGATFKEISKKVVEQIPIPVPPIAEQEKIVAELDCLSGIIEKKKQQLKELDNLAQSIFYEMFGDPVENDKGWERLLFEKCIEKVRYTAKIATCNYSTTGAFPIISQEEDYISGYWNNAEDVFMISKPVVIFGDHTRVLKYVDFDFVLGADGVKILQPIDTINAKFFLYYLIASKIPSLGYSRHYKLLKELKVLLPPLSLQQDFASKIESIEKQKELLAQSIKETETLFNSRMDYYFN